MANVAIQSLARSISKWRNWPGCSNAECKGNALKHAMSKKHFGVSLFEEWFCGPECFEQGARRKILDLLANRQSEKTPTLRMPLGLLLVSRGILTHDQLKIALEQQRMTGANFGEIVQELGYATQQQVTAGVAAQWGCPVFSMGDRPAPAAVRIPRQILELYGMMPVHYSDIGRRVMIGFVSRVQHHLLYTIEQITSCTATPCFITATEFQRCVHSLLLNAAENEVVFERENTPLEIARTVRSYAIQSGAAQARLGMCKDYLWARVLGRQEMDLLFKLSMS